MNFSIRGHKKKHESFDLCAVWKRSNFLRENRSGTGVLQHVASTLVLLSLGTVDCKLKILQNRSKTAVEAKGLQYNTDKVSESQCLFNVDLYAYLAIYIYRYG